jgi:hypothetical protein
VAERSRPEKKEGEARWDGAPPSNKEEGQLWVR